MAGVVVRPAVAADVAAIGDVAEAAGQDDDWGGGNPAYLRHLSENGRVMVAVIGGRIAGFGAVQRLGHASEAATMLCDLFVDPAAQGRGCGRAMLTELWAGSARRMTFSSLHANAVPLYTSFGLDAWWPLLYLHGEPSGLPAPQRAGQWSVEPAGAELTAGYERAWTGTDRQADLRAWAARPAGECILVRRGTEVVGAGAVSTGRDRGIVHLAVAPAADDAGAAAVVLRALAHLAGSPGGAATVCLPAPHPAVRALLAAGWQFDEFDLFMASEPGLLDPRRAVPSAAQA